MKARVKARIKNSPAMPIKEFTAEAIIEFEEADNVFGRAFRARQYFREKYGQEIDLEIIDVVFVG